MRYLRVRYVLCGTEDTVKESFVRDYNDFTLEVGQVEWVFWSPDPKDTPASVLKVAGKVLTITTLLQQKQGGKGIPAYYRAQILLIRDTSKLIEATLDAEESTCRLWKQPTTKNDIKEKSRIYSIANLFTPDPVVSEQVSSQTSFKFPVAVAVSPPSQRSSKKANEVLQSESEIKRSFLSLQRQLELTQKELKERKEETQSLKRENVTLLRKNIRLHEKLNLMLEKELNRVRSQELDCASVAISERTQVTRSSTPKSVVEASVVEPEDLTVNSCYSTELTLNDADFPFGEPDMGNVNMLSAHGNADLSSILSVASSNLSSRAVHHTFQTIDPDPSTMQSCFQSTSSEIQEKRSISDEQFKFIMGKCKQGKPGDSIFVRHLAEILWDREHLARRSVTGNSCVWKKNDPGYPECTPYKKDIIKECMKRRLEGEQVTCEKEIKKRIASIRENLNGKIKSVRVMVFASSSTTNK